MINEYCNLTFSEWALFFLSVLFDILLFVSVLVNSNLFPPPLYVLIEMLPTKVPVTVDNLCYSYPLLIISSPSSSIRLFVLVEVLPMKVPVTVDSLIIAVTEVEGVVGVDM